MPTYSFFAKELDNLPAGAIEVEILTGHFTKPCPRAHRQAQIDGRAIGSRHELRCWWYALADEQMDSAYTDLQAARSFVPTDRFNFGCCRIERCNSQALA